MSNVLNYQRELLIPTLSNDSENNDFIVSCSGSYNTQYPAYLAFDGTNTNDSDCCLLPSSGDRWLKISLNAQVSINGLVFTSRNTTNPGLVYDNAYDVYISSDDSIYTKIITFGSPTNANTKKEFIFPRHKCKYIKLVPKNNTFTAIGDLNFYICHEFYVLKQDEKYYSFNPAQYDTTSKLFKETDVITIKDNINSDVNQILAEKYFLTTPMTIGGETFVPIDKFNSSFQLVSVVDTNCSVYGIKTNKQLIIPKSDISTKMAQHIYCITSTINKDSDCSIKFVVSNDQGFTWKTTTDNGNTWTDIISNVNLDTTNNSNWNSSLDLILDSGISIDNLNNIQFDALLNNNSKLRFAISIYITGINSNAIISDLLWKIDNVGYMKQLSGTDVEIDVYTDRIKIIPEYDISKLKVVVGTGGTINVTETTGDDSTEAINQDVIEMVSEVW